MGKISDEMPSIKKLQDDIESMEHLSPLMGKGLRDKIQEQKKQLNDFLSQIETFNENFSDRGWIAYERIPMTLVKKANDVYRESGVEEAEKVLISYYSTEVEDMIHILKAGCEELKLRYHLVLKAYEDHKSSRYHASVPLFLMIADGTVNDYTRSKGFFAEGTDVDAWDCLVGYSEGLTKLKNIYSASRKKTNTDPIYLPYRHGILHGRDLNYGNVYVSSKCIALLFAIREWMINKESEDTRRQKLLESQRQVSWSGVIDQIRENNETKAKLASWKPRVIVIGKDIPESGNSEQYSEYDYVQRVVEMLESWKSRNYGQLSILLQEMFRHVKPEGARPRECRELFQDKVLIDFKLLEVEERGCALRKVVVEVQWKVNERTITDKMVFGLVYRGHDGRPLIPYDVDGMWVIMPWDVRGLYKI